MIDAMRTVAEIKEMIATDAIQSIFGFRQEVLMGYLRWEDAKSILKDPEGDEDGWGDYREPTMGNVLEDMKIYNRQGEAACAGGACEI